MIKALPWIFGVVLSGLWRVAIPGWKRRPILKLRRPARSSWWRRMREPAAMLLSLKAAGATPSLILIEPFSNGVLLTSLTSPCRSWPPRWHNWA